jgi:transcriptional regulator with XRE-family HTH domain
MTMSEKTSTLWRKVRLSLDLGQKEFAAKLGVGAGYVSEIESGKKEPSHTLAELFRYIYQEASGPISTNLEETDDMLQKELLELYRRNAELCDRVFELEKLLQKKAGRSKKKIS